MSSQSFSNHLMHTDLIADPKLVLELVLLLYIEPYSQNMGNMS